MNDIQVFQNAQFGQIRTAVTEAGEPLFAGIDIANLLGYSNSRKAIRDHVDEDDRILMKLADFQDRNELGAHMKESDIVAITESGVYSLIFGSNLPSAKDFKKWVTSEVLPAMRKTGGYIVSRTDETPEQIMARALIVAQNTIKRTEERARQLEERVTQQDNALQLKDDFIERQQEQIKRDEEVIKVQAPKVKAFEEMISSEGLISITQIAMELGMSAIALNRKLCALGVQYNQGCTYILYAKYKDKNYATLRACPAGLDQYGNPRTRMHLYWYQRGRAFIRELLKAV